MWSCKPYPQEAGENKGRCRINPTHPSTTNHSMWERVSAHRNKPSCPNLPDLKDLQLIFHISFATDLSIGLHPEREPNLILL